MRPPFPLKRLTSLCVVGVHRNVAAQMIRCCPSFVPVLQLPPTNPRTFSASPALHKKGGKPSKGYDVSQQSQGHTATSLGGSGEDPFDFSELEENITKAHAKLRDDLSKLRAGGKFNPDVVDNLRVTLAKDTKDTVRLGDLAQVVPRGRILNVIAGEKDHIKAIASVIQSSDLSLTPQTDPQNPLQLNISLPPPTKESRQQTVQAATKAADTAATAIRNARQTQQKKLRAMQTSRAARPDDLKKAGDKMEKVVERGTAEAKKIVESAKKVLESG